MVIPTKFMIMEINHSDLNFSLHNQLDAMDGDGDGERDED